MLFLLSDHGELQKTIFMNSSYKYTYAVNVGEILSGAAQGGYLSIVGDAPVDVLEPLATHGTEAHLQLLGDHIAAQTQPATHLHQHVVIMRQCLQDLVKDRSKKCKVD